MFESDTKKHLKRKYDKSVKSPKSKHETLSNFTSVTAPNTVYGELKLSEQLHDQLSVLKSRFDFLQEELEDKNEIINR